MVSPGEFNPHPASLPRIGSPETAIGFMVAMRPAGAQRPGVTAGHFDDDARWRHRAYAAMTHGEHTPSGQACHFLYP